MPVCITGMHRSGTSLVARLLQGAGLDLGPPAELIGADEHNADGYYENRRFLAVNEALLQLLHGGWDSPPEAAPGWERGPELRPYHESVANVVQELGLREPWGWKDPRNALTLPFWLEALPGLKVVVCARNPLEVLLSLQRRGLTSPALGLRLWEEYNRRVLAAAPPERRVVTAYGSYFARPGEELRRLVRALGLEEDEERLAAAAAGASAGLRHHEIGDDLGYSGVPEGIDRLYRQLLDEAAGGPPVRVSEDVSSPVSDEDLGRLAYVLSGRQQAASYRLDRDEWRSEAERRAAAAERLLGELEAARAAAAGNAAELAGAQQLLAGLVAAGKRASDEAEALRRRVDGLEGERDEARLAAAAASGRVDAAAAELEAVRAELADSRREAAGARDRAQAQRERLTQEREAARVEAAGAGAEAEQHAVQARALRKELAKTKEAQRRQSGELERLRATAREQAAALAALGEDVEARTAETARLRQEADAAARALAAAEAGRRRLDEEAAALSARLEAVEAELARSAEETRVARAALARRGHRLRSLSQLLGWLLRPTPKRVGYVRAYLTLRRAGSFDRGAYLARYPDVAEAGLDPLMHYVEHGVREGRDPAPQPLPGPRLVAAPPPRPPSAPPLQRAPAPARAAPDAPGLVRPPLEAEVATVEASGLFDADWYCEHHPDVLDAGARPVEHFCVVGWREGRRPNAYFDPEWYLRTYPEVEAAGVNPLWHYVVSGEDRRPSALFDPAYYLRAYGRPEGSRSVLADYLGHVRAGNWRNPVDLFDVAHYLAQNGDVRAAGLDPVLHYLYTGHAEGRNPSPGFSTSSYRSMYLGGRPDVNPLVHYYETALSGEAAAPPRVGRHVADQVRLHVAPGEAHEELDPTLAAGGERRAKAIAFYLPQFHAIPENDEWWGKGFTEWRNVMRGVPRFVGHYQPRVPGDLGFYDLSSPDVLPRQVELARAAGLHGFGFYYYWFNGKRLLERPLEQFLADSSLDLPFCLMWANENWTRRWDGHEDEVLVRQEYRRDDDEALVDDLQRHFADPRYLRLGGRPLLVIYRLDTVPRARRTVTRWRRLWQARHGEEPLLFLAQGFGSSDPREFGLDGAIEFPPHKLVEGLQPVNGSLSILDPSFTGHVVDYQDVVERSLSEPQPEFPLVKTAVPGWDNDARRQGAGLTLRGSTPSRYERWLRGLTEIARRHPVHGEPLVFVNAWNEWAEAAYLEPDVHFGSAYLNATARALRAPAAASGKRKVLFVGHDAHPHGAQINVWHMGEMLRNQFGCDVAYLLRAGGELVPRYEELGRTCVTGDEPERTRAFLQELHDEGFEQAVTNTAVSGAVVPALKDAGFRVVSLIHELPGVIRALGLEPELEHIMRRSDAVVAPAAVVADAIRAHGSSRDAEKIVIRPQGLYQEIGERPQARKALRRRLGLPSRARIVLNVGFGDDRKGVDLFVAAAERALEPAGDLHFVWVGHLHVDVERRLEAEGWRERPNVHFVPYTDDVAEWYRAADVFFLSSREDPFPSVVLEALSIGLPVVAFRGSGGVEALVAEHGTLVDRDDPGGAAAALAGAAHEDDAAARRRRRAAVAERYRFDEYCFELLRLLDPALRKVSVVVPNFDYGRYLGERLESIFAQTYPIFELLVLDDCSGDGSLEELERLRAASGRRFRVVPSDENSGAAFHQWSRGCELAAGDYVWIAEADDVSRPRFLEQVAAVLDDGVAYAFSDSSQIDEEGEPLGASYRPYCALAAGDLMERDFALSGHEFVRRCLLERNLVLNVSAVVWRREVLAEVLSRRLEEVTGFRLAGDWLLYAATALADGRSVAYVAEPLNVHRRHDGSVTGALEKRQHLDEVQRVHAALGEWVGAEAVERARMEAYEAELAAQFGLDRDDALQAG